MYYTKRRIADIAAKIWSRWERADGRETVRTVLTVAGHTVEPKRPHVLDVAARKLRRKR